MTRWTSPDGRYTSDPAVSMGRVCLAGTAIPCRNVAERRRAGEGTVSVCADTGLTHIQVAWCVAWDDLALRVLVDLGLSEREAQDVVAGLAQVVAPGPAEDREPGDGASAAVGGGVIQPLRAVRHVSDDRDLGLLALDSGSPVAIWPDGHIDPVELVPGVGWCSTEGYGRPWVRVARDVSADDRRALLERWRESFIADVGTDPLAVEAP